MRKYSFPPIIDKNSRVLILGTMPGNISLKMNQYYANPQNLFWHILSSITGDTFMTRYEEKKVLLLKNRIALWDVLMHCERRGSLDVNIREEYPNNFTTLFRNYPGIEQVGFNGQKAEKLFTKFHLHKAGITYHTLPSTSSANASLTFEQKAVSWKNIFLEL